MVPLTEVAPCVPLKKGGNMTVFSTDTDKAPQDFEFFCVVVGRFFYLWWVIKETVEKDTKRGNNPLKEGFKSYMCDVCFFW